MRKIKKYANRKLYDTTDKQYISLESLSKLIKDGEAVEIIDNTSGEDITSAVVSQLLAREQKDKEEVPSSILIGLLRKGSGTVSDYAKKSAGLWKTALATAEDEIDKVFKTLVKDKDLSSAEASRLRKEIGGYLASSRKWVAQQVDQRIKDVLGAMNLASKEQVAELTRKIESLTEKIERLEKSGAAGGGEPPKEPKVEPKPPGA
ncbi:MAG: polyhydroxyalkanoate synthesis regulator DNA-binding domain-containing protein [Desulfobacterales bacterium]